MHWPEHFPQGCPPDKAISVSGEVFRLTDKQQPKERDFRSYFELRKDQEWDDPCKASSLSVYTDIEDVLRLKRRVPGARPKWVARGILQEDDGVFLNTPGAEKSHYSWWVPEGREPWKQFTALLQPNGTKT